MMNTIMDAIINISINDFCNVLVLVYDNITSTIDIIINQIRHDLANSHLTVNGFNGRSMFYSEKYRTLIAYHNTSINISNLLLDYDVDGSRINRIRIEVQREHINILGRELLRSGYLR
jgi:hypothetical protein